MASYLDMQTRIADELDLGSTMTAQIKKAILSAVAHYERKTFYFSETSFTFSTVAGQEYYGTAAAAAIATSPKIEILWGLYNGLRFDLTKRSFKYISQISVVPSTSRSMSFEWAYRARQIRLYPIPDNVYTLTAVSIPRLTSLSADGDTNAWTEDAEELIRSHAKIDLIVNTIRGSDMEAEVISLKAQERDAKTALYGENASRAATGYAEPTQF